MSDESFGTITSLKVVANYENNSRVTSKTLLYSIKLFFKIINILRITLLTERNIYYIYNYIIYFLLNILTHIIFYSIFS